jgi:glycerol transport system ATP-binding protein
MSMGRITLDGIGHSYAAPGAREKEYALQPMHHVWEQGVAYALLGPSGCGKTTLLNIISGLVTPSEGRLFFGDRDVTYLPTEKRNIAQVFQFPVIYDTMTVAQNLAFPLKNRGMAGDRIKTRVAEVADLLGLTGDLGRKARGLTADAKQKISLGRGLVREDVSAVLFDEPLTVIDPGLKWELRSKLRQVHRALDLLMIYVTHDQVEALTFADRVVVMKEGRVLQIGTPVELFERPEHTFVGYFIGSPGMNLLSAEVKGDHARIGSQEIRLGATYPSLQPRVPIRIGIRPDYAALAGRGEGLRARIERIDDLGRSRLARVSVDGQKLIATVPPDLSIPADEAGVVLDPRHIHVYANEYRVEGEGR